MWIRNFLLIAVTALMEGSDIEDYDHIDLISRAINCCMVGCPNSCLDCNPANCKCQKIFNCNILPPVEPTHSTRPLTTESPQLVNTTTLQTNVSSVKKTSKKFGLVNIQFFEILRILQKYSVKKNGQNGIYREQDAYQT